MKPPLNRNDDSASLESDAKPLARSAYLKAIAYLAGGQGLAALLPFFFAPVLGRLYHPLEYAGLAFYMAFANVAGVIATMQFQQGILVESRRNAAAIVWLCLLSTFCTSVLSGLIVLGLWNVVAYGSVSGYWLALMPLTILQTGLATASTFLANHHALYSFLSRVGVVQVVATLVVSIALGFLSFGADGLFLGYFAGQFAQFAMHTMMLRRLIGYLPRPSWFRMLALARRHREFPLFTLPSVFLGTMTMEAPVFALNAIGATESVGAFVRARQLASMPVNVIGGAISQVFRREAAIRYRETGSCRPLLLRTTMSLFILGFLPSLVLFVFAPELFTLYLGPNWTEAGKIASILAPMLLLRLAVSPITSVFWFTGRQRLEFYLSTLSLIVLASTLILSYKVVGTPAAMIMGFSAAYGATYVVYFLSALKVSSR